MKKFSAFIVSLCLVLGTMVLSVPQAQAQVPVFDNQLGDTISDVLTVVEFHYSLYLGNRNREMINSALLQERIKLNPGQSVNYLIIATGSTQHPIFRRIEKESNGLFLSNSEWVVGRVTLRSERYVYSAYSVSLPIPSRADFNSDIKDSFPSEVSYDDYVYLIHAINAMSTAREVGKSKMYDLLDNTAFAGADGTVILTARASDSTYRVYDVTKSREDSMSYKKGSNLQELGNTVWVLCQSNRGEYVLVYSNLSKINVSIGDRVRAGSTTIGIWGDSPRHGFALYRVHGPQQYFLRPTGSPAPYSILPQ